MSDTIHTNPDTGHDDHAHHAHVAPGFIKKYIFSADHKIIGIQFLFMGLMFFVIGGLLAMLVRWQLAWPSDPNHPVPILGKLLWGQKQADGSIVAGSMPADFYTMAFTMHATIMIFFVIIPLLVGTFGNYLVPLKIGAGDMAFPFLNGLAFWSAIPAGAIMLTGFFLPGNAAAAGWTSYPPLSAIQETTSQLPYVYSVYSKPANSSEAFDNKWQNYTQFFRIGSPGAKLDRWSKTKDGVILRMSGSPHAILDSVKDTLKSQGYTGMSVTDSSTSPNEFYSLSKYDIAATSPAGAPITLTLSEPTELNKVELLVPGAKNVNEPFVASLLSPLSAGWQGTWPIAPILVTFFCWFMLFAFVGAYFVRFDSTAMNVVTTVVLSILLGFAFAKGTQYASFDGQSCWFLSLFILGFSSIMGAVNYLTTMIKLRCPGMTMFRMPLSVWSLFITSILVLLATPVLASALLMNLMEHHSVTIGGNVYRLASFFTPFNWTLTNQIQGNAGGGFPLLHQHLFWFYSHPAVYIMILPAMGMVSDIMAVFARKPVFGYRPMIYAMGGIAFLGFIVWAHHMFQSGLNPTLGTTFAISTMFIAVPSAIKTFNWLGTLWGGNIRYTTPMLNAIAFVSMFVIGGLSGIFMASTAVDVHIHDTYFIVAHIHYVLFGASVFGIFASIYFWYPKMFGRMMNETLGKIHFWLSFITFNCTFFAMHILGIGGMPRRIASYMDYSTFQHFQPMNQFISYSAFALGLSQIIFAINFIGSWMWGPKAPRNPWLATTLEWETASPPPHGNFETVPIVHHGPYEYSSPLVEEDYLLQTRYVEGADKLVVKH